MKTEYTDAILQEMKEMKENDYYFYNANDEEYFHVHTDYKNNPTYMKKKECSNRIEIISKDEFEKFVSSSYTTKTSDFQYYG